MSLRPLLLIGSLFACRTEVKEEVGGIGEDDTATPDDDGDDGEDTIDDDDDEDDDTAGPDPVDADGDGYLEEDDCNDEDPAIHPGATELCDGLDNDCDGETDEDGVELYHPDADGDGFGDPDALPVESCAPVDAHVTDATDCDDSDFEVNPAADEICNTIDDDCDTLVDDADPDVDLSTGAVFFTDGDADGYGSTETAACAQPSGSATTGGDCLDTDAAVNPGATEVCNGIDDDCDLDIDDADSSLDLSTGSTFYADADGDGFGDAAASSLSCEAGANEVGDATDCDDTDASVSPAASETWYDGIDQDCDGAGDYDQDADGDDALDHGGTDCDDLDPTRLGGTGCRPQASCSRPSLSTLTSYDPPGATDLVFDSSCRAVISTIISGPDYVYVVDGAGTQTIYDGPSNYDIASVALDPLTGSIVAGFSSTQGVGYASGSSLPAVALSGTGYLSYGPGPYTNYFLNDSPMAIAMDTRGCIWTPNWAALGVLACVGTSGSVSTMTLSSNSITSLALDSTEGVFIAIDDTIYEVDTALSTLATFYTASDTILDFVFDYDDSIYVETADDLITRVETDGSSSTFASVTGDARLAISPDGYLVRLIGNPTGAATWEELELGD